VFFHTAPEWGGGEKKKKRLHALKPFLSIIQKRGGEREEILISILREGEEVPNNFFRLSITKKREKKGRKKGGFTI